MEKNLAPFRKVIIFLWSTCDENDSMGSR